MQTDEQDSPIPPPAPPLDRDADWDDDHDDPVARGGHPSRLFVALAVIGMVAAFGFGRLGTGAARADAASATADRDDAASAQQRLTGEVDGLEEQVETLQGDLTQTQELLDAARSDADDRAARVESLESELDTTQGDVRVAEERASEAEQAAEGADARAVEKAREQVREENETKTRQLDQRAAGLDERESGLDTRENGLDDRASALDDAEAEVERNTFGNGTWEVGVDIEPGKYKSDGGDPCYWAKLRINDNDIIDNEIGEGPKVVVLDSGILFESSRCADWRKVS